MGDKQEMSEIYERGVGMAGPYVGQPGMHQLDAWGAMLKNVFGVHPMLVGSAVVSKEWRDIDVVVVLDRDEFYGWTGSRASAGWRFNAICTSFSLWGKEMTGLPIDFKLQLADTAAETFKGRPRYVLGLLYEEKPVEKEAPKNSNSDEPVVRSVPPVMPDSEPRPALGSHQSAGSITQNMSRFYRAVEKWESSGRVSSGLSENVRAYPEVFMDLLAVWTVQ